ncbi:hypothetical protein [Staphylococcus agnetis]|uniref:Uncharacterized protein n=1 Tax=Staphylococcus agnetis TaxID=985762 RepID=A0ABX3Z335_9STAP|nr:hypothetical protein [Staphylococcus agnetis]ALN76098.1 hypothetical protein EP23_01370 [Staphylococcus agnetis]MDG4943616.1 hypothetical protein [Staphylococcus agnetis]OSP19627.1 hypothetical protein B9L42_07675 [Staphylococcus agnetis]OSP24578.1 hypothetical protein B9M87_03190 [Staphylococcus agnetis]OTW30320.1 hypothetical protein B9M88_11005 [Staphylococcus agnetis]
MTNVDYKKAYEYLESQLEDIMLETSILLDHNPATLRIDEIIANQTEEGKVTITICSSGEQMKYALYIYKKGQSIPEEKLMYQAQNVFQLSLEPGKYRIKAFVQQNNTQKVAETKEIKVF